ncbi:hypothetical protein [Pendulispora albinea]|uniref:Uncharacterized protein n=1 Tax=Pendulispora albinea TaxID=2741071 RepID=A0ABZ2M5I3_9BACT
MRRSQNWIAALGFMVAISIVYCANLQLGLGFWSSLPGWFWWRTEKPAEPQGLALLAAGWIFAVSALQLAQGRSTAHLARPARDRARMVVVAVLVFGAALLFSFGHVLLEGRGLDPSRRYLAYVQGACLHSNPLAVIRYYEDIVRSEYWFGGFYRTKPPGLAAMYTIACNIACGFPGPLPDHEGRMARTVDLLVWIWPLFSAASAVLVGLFTARISRPRSSRPSASRDRMDFALGGVLFASTPAVGIVVMNADQFLYPGLVASSGLALVRALDGGGTARGRAGSAALGAIWMWVFCFFHFSTLAAAAGLLGGAGLALAVRMVDRSVPRRETWRIAASLALTLCLVTVLAFVVLRYDPLMRYRDAMAAHIGWKGFTDTPRERAYWASIDLLELSMTSGWPLACLATFGAFSLLSEPRRWLRPQGALLLMPMVFLLAAAWVGKTKGETGRIWIFSLAFTVPLAVERLRAIAPRRLVLSASTVVGLQVVAAIFLKRYQDFRPH